LATAGVKAARHGPTLDRLPDRILVDIGLDPESYRRRGWTEYVQQLSRHIGPMRA
jgi:hypothetical protein